MTRSLRHRHRHAFVVLGILLPAVFVIGILGRKPVPVVNELAPTLSATPVTPESVIWKRGDLFAKTPVEVHLLQIKDDSGRFAVECFAPKDFIKPDLIVYWVAGNAGITERLPGNAILLGAFYSPALPLPDEATKSSGVLALYSLADNEIVDVSKPFVAGRTRADGNPFREVTFAATRK